MVRVLLQLKVNRLCLVVDGTAGFDPKPTPRDDVVLGSVKRSPTKGPIIRTIVVC